MALKVGITHSLRLLAGLLLSLAPLPSLAVTVSQPYPIVPHTTASSSQVQADFSALYSTINGYIDASNLASSTGIYASQIIPTSSGQATFGGAQSYTFPQTVTAMNNLVFGNNTTGGTLNGSTGSASISGSYIGTGLSITGNAAISGTTSLSGALNAAGGTTTNGLVNNSTSALNGIVKSQNAFQTQVGGTGPSYVVPYDENSTSGSNNTHYGHNSATITFTGSTFACSSTIGFNHIFSANPDILLTMIGAVLPSATLYINSRTTSNFQACANNPTSATATLTFSWHAEGE